MAMQTFQSFGRGTCATCSAPIQRGDLCAWGPTKGSRVHAQCAIVRPQETRINRIWSEHQQAVFAAITEGTDSLIVQAVAGSGKTTTIKEACNRIPDVLVKYLVFNSRNSQEAQATMPDNVDVSTFHACCWAALSRRLGLSRNDIDGNKTRAILNDMVAEGSVSDAEAKAFGPAVVRLVDLAKCVGIGALVPDTLEQWGYVVEHWGLEFDTPEGVSVDVDVTDRAIDIARELLTASNAFLESVDFSDQLYLTVKLKVALPTFAMVMVDEAQDTNPIRRAVLRKILAPGGRLIAVGDPKQAIYGFTGADADAMDRIRDEFGCRTLPLSVNYRCGKAIINTAKQFCPEIEAHDGAPEGEVLDLDSFSYREFRSTDAVLCRLTAPIVTLAYRLLAQGIGCTVLGRDIGAGLVALIRKMQGKRKRDLTIEELVERLETYLHREVAKYKAKGQDDKVQSVQDKVESLFAAIEYLPEGSRTILSLTAHIEQLFSDKAQSGLLTLSTVHKSKGLEWERVFILNPDNMPSKWARQAWQLEQEHNLMYVAATRAKQTLAYLPLEAIH